MQFTLTLQTTSPQPVLPINYQYELSAWIYSVIEHADTAYAAFLHQQGYQTGRKSFKMFSFGNLYVPKFEVRGDRLHILSREVQLPIGFYVDRTAEEFIRGLFATKTFRIGDRQSQATFVVNLIEMKTLPPLRGDVPTRLRTRSPLVIAQKGADGGPDQYLPPDDPAFGPLLLANLMEKYRAATGQEALPPDWQPETWVYRPVGTPPRSRLVTMKAHTKAETRVRGYLFDFELVAPPALLEVGLLAGFGRHNAGGFGHCTTIF